MSNDWRDAEAYAYFDELDAPGLAWECLRRNPHYRASYPDLMPGTHSLKNWGLRFPCRPEAGCPRGGGDLVTN